MKINKQIISWSLYDWGNSAFFTTVIGAFFPIFFKNYWSHGDSVESTYYLGIAHTISSLIVAILAPFLGAIADKTSTKKKFLIFFAFLGAIMTLSLSMVAEGKWQMAILFFIIANVGVAGGNLFYDSLLIGVAGDDEKACDDVSSLGFSLGYLGGGLLFAINVLMTLKPEFFGLRDATHAVQVSFISVGIWWAVFTIPLILFVKEPKVTQKHSIPQAIKAGYDQLAVTFREVKSMKVVFTFLIAYWLYIDGVDTIIKMAVDYGMALGFNSNSLIIALLITQFVAFPAVLVFNIMSKKIGIKKALYIAIIAYSLITLAGMNMKQEIHFYILAVCIGLFQGGIQAASRSYYTRIIPSDKAGEFFGFYNMLGKFAAIIGPLLVGIITKVSNSNRVGIASVLILFIAGFIILTRVNTEEGKELSEKL